MSQVTVHTLLKRVFEARAAGRLQAFLRALKQDQNLAKDAFDPSASRDLLEDEVAKAVALGAVSIDALAGLVDEIEENGAQHVYLFDLTDAGHEALVKEKFQQAFAAAPGAPTEALYADQPSTKRTMFMERDGFLDVKQVFTADFWEKNDDESQETNSRRTVVYDRVVRRAVNLLRIDRATREVEIRVDRVRDRMDDSLAEKMLRDFLATLAPVFNPVDHLNVVEIWRGFPGIVADMDKTYMTTDRAQDPSVAVIVSSRRAKGKGTDIRTHESFANRGNTYARKSLNIYWRFKESADAPEKLLHTVLSRQKRQNASERDLAKVYIAARLTAAEQRHVIARIRQSTPPAAQSAGADQPSGSANPANPAG